MNESIFSTIENSEPTTYCNAVIPTSTVADTMAFFHAELGISVKSTVIKAADNGHFASWPGMTPENVRMYFKNILATAKGHLVQTRTNQASTHAQ